MTAAIHNPVLTGFNPDPVIFTDGERYYLAVSTFEWLPGIRVYSSPDLVTWTYETSILTDTTQIDLAGNPLGCSVWAPFITYREGTFYLVYTNVRSQTRPYKDCDNYISTAPSLHGPWTAPVYVNSSGFDPSLFFGDDGRVYFVNEIWDYRMTTRNKSAGIVMQEIDPATWALVGEPRKIFDGTAAAKTEAPNIYRRDGWYYLITAEGGTEAGHQVTVAHSRSVWGPYEVDPLTPMLTSRDDRALPLQCAGHASIISTPAGEWYMAHLVTRPFDGDDPVHAVLGREAAIQKVEWTEDGWLRLAGGGNHPRVDVDAPAGAPADAPAVAQAQEESGAARSTGFTDPLRGTGLDTERWNTYRQFPGAWLRPGQDGLMITGGQSPQSVFDQHLVATRQCDFDLVTSVHMDYRPGSYLQLAGMALYLDITNDVLFMVTVDADGRPCAVLQNTVAGTFSQISSVPVQVDPDGVGHFDLRVEIHGPQAVFTVDDGTGERSLGELDIRFLSGGFTGNFIGLDVIDMHRRGSTSATFTDFAYVPESSEA